MGITALSKANPSFPLMQQPDSRAVRRIDRRVWDGAQANYTDDFEDGTIAGAWSSLNVSGVASIDEVFGAGRLTTTESIGTTVRAQLRSVPAGNWVLTAKFGLMMEAVASADSGLILRESSSGKLTGVALTHASAVVHRRWTNPTTILDTPVSLAALVRAFPIYFRIKKTATNIFDFAMSPDGYAWMDVSVGYSTVGWATPDQFGWYANNAASNTSVVSDCFWFQAA